jgi:cyclophilin family peptidyl-prolyl cis-trans isomerase
MIMSKTMKRIISNALAAIALTACVGTFGACETNQPKVRLTVAFNGEKYELEYTMYRKVTPTTVKHFLALVENGYYDGLCVHDYNEANAMHTGAYIYNTQSKELEYKDYYATVASYLPQSVWLDKEKQQPTYTLYGESKANDFEVKNGALQEQFGALVMTYETMDEVKDVYVERNDGAGVSRRDYKENSATSKFYISLSSTVKTNEDYCVFATLTDSGIEELKELKQAIADYAEKTYENTSNFTSKKYGEIKDKLIGDSEEAYDVPNAPIVIEDAEVIKW